MRIRLATVPLAAAALALAGCSHEISAPSLLPRAVEKQPIDMPVATSVEAESAPDAALTAKIASIVAAAEAGDRAFAAQRTRTETAVGRGAGAGQGSDPWVEAQEAITALESARAPVRDAANAVDGLRDDPANAAPGNRAAIDAAAARVSALNDGEAAAIAALSAKLG